MVEIQSLKSFDKSIIFICLVEDKLGTDLLRTKINTDTTLLTESTAYFESAENSPEFSEEHQFAAENSPSKMHSSPLVSVILA